MAGLSFMDFAKRVDRMSVRDGSDRFRNSCEFAYDFCHDFCRPPCDRSPKSWSDLSAAMQKWGAMTEAREGAKAAWIEYQIWKIEEDEYLPAPRSRLISQLDEFLSSDPLEV